MPIDDLDCYEWLLRESLNLPPTKRVHTALHDDVSDEAMSLGPTPRAVAAVDYRDLGEG